MANINKVIILGNLGRNPEVRYTPEGSAICNISVATASGWRDKSTGERHEQTEWHNVVFFGRLAEVAGEYLRKGSQVYIEGRLRTRKWTGQDGIERFTTEIVAQQMQMLGNRDDTGLQGENGKPKRNAYAEASSGSSSKSANKNEDAPF